MLSLTAVRPYFLPRNTGRSSVTRSPMAKFIAAPIATARTSLPNMMPRITATAEGASPK